MKYRQIPPLPYCCVPACVQMVLDRHGLEMPDQETIATELGLVTPYRYARQFSEDHRGMRPTTNFGTRIHWKRYSMDRFFARHNYPLEFSRTWPEEVSLDYLQTHAEDDLLFCSDSGGYGHLTLLERIRGKTVVIHDPESGLLEMPFPQVRAGLRPAEAWGGVWRIALR